jgi:DNA repair exonuclease SbcCD ATPase subunit
MVMPQSAQNERFDRIETKIDKLTDAVILMAKMEQKIDNYEKYRDESWARMNRFSEKLDAIEKKVDDNHRTVSTINKLFWVVIIAAAGAVATNLWM